jgi:hypothetical protein
MRKQARRLWFGDWQRGDEAPTPAEPVGAGSDQADTVVITPVDDGAAERRAERQRNLRRGIASVAAIAVLCALGFALLSGGDDNRLTSERPQDPSTQTPQAQPQVPQSQLPQTPQAPQGAAPPGFGGPDLTGPGAVKAAKAALAKYPGDIERVTAGPGGGGYVVHVIQCDGNEVHVVVSGKFKVLGSDAAGNPPRFGDGGTRCGPAPQSGSMNQS